MVVDTSALIAIAFVEPDADRFLDAIEVAAMRLTSAATALEAAIIVEAPGGGEAGDDLDALVQRLGLEAEPVTAEQVRIAGQAWRTYGEGTGHPAGLNYSDCFEGSQRASVVQGRRLRADRPRVSLGVCGHRTEPARPSLDPRG